ncbi:M20/M25/M40 family metallo-hydrolase [Nesterenkonia ebinurensis]|uniref:M20/M25/M40 family metallo-hydrolase n=1 Tax=Nesterenkonia ebinurensis TaxID=2608252 RepID=UPI00123D7865|nr:M20/M25/M40 family metallo-hydrolase [Nesterenkonia ebinurensis]
MSAISQDVRARIFDKIDTDFDLMVEKLREYIAIPSVSVANDQVPMASAAQFLAEQYRQFGCSEVEVVPTETYPGVWAYYDAGAPVTLLNYTMYDVRTAGNSEDWSAPPFEGRRSEGPNGEDIFYGRGAQVPKGPDLAWLAGLRAYRDVAGELPVNIAFLAEGDEILGSASYAELLRRYHDRVQEVDGVVYLRAAQNPDGTVPVRLGYKAFITVELRALGGNWKKGPAGTAHAAVRTLVGNPAQRLAEALTSLFDADGEPAVDGWKNLLKSLEVPEADEPLVERLLAHYAESPIEKVVPALEAAEAGEYLVTGDKRTLLERYIYGSAFNIQGLRAGYMGAGTRTHTIPHEAVARLDARLMTDADPSVIVDHLRAHLDEKGFPDIEIDVLSAWPASRMGTDDPLMGSFLDTVKQYGGDPLLWPTQAYGGPWSLLVSGYKLPVVFGVGIGHGRGVGQPDEYVVLRGNEQQNGLREISQFTVDFIAEYAQRAVTA